MPLKIEFYDRPTLDVARDLIGCLLVRKSGQGIRAGRIIETEAYICLNFVTEREGFPAAVLIRPLEPVRGFDRNLAELPAGKRKTYLNGPGRLCREMEITRDLNRHDVTKTGGLYVLPRDVIPARITQTPRVGVAYAGDDALLPWRFVVASP